MYKHKYKVAIVGFGARELSILERLISKILDRKIANNFHIFIFDLLSLGSGCHYSLQSYYLLANTVASQMTIFADESICPNEFFYKRSNFF